MNTTSSPNTVDKDLDELHLWLQVVQRTVIPASGSSLTTTEKDTLARCCHALALTAQSVATKLAS